MYIWTKWGFFAELVSQFGTAGLWAITLASAAAGRWHGPVGPFRFVRARMIAFTSGAANVVLVGENRVSDVVATVKAVNLSVNNTGVAAAAVTLTSRFRRGPMRLGCWASAGARSPCR